MELQFTGKNIVVTPALKEFTTEKLQTLENHFHNIQFITVVFFLDGELQAVEANLHINSTDINARAKNGDMYIAVTELIEKLTHQLTKHKEKLIDHHR